MEEPKKPEDPPWEIVTYKIRPSWAHEIIQDVEKYGALDEFFREIKIPQTYSSYMALLSNIIDVGPSSYTSSIEKKVWKDAMLEQYQLIMKNGVWDVVLRPEGKLVVTSKWIYKIKDATDGSIEKYNPRFMDRGFSQKEGIDYEDTFSPIVRYTSIRAIMVFTAKMVLSLRIWKRLWQS